MNVRGSRHAIDEDFSDGNLLDKVLLHGVYRVEAVDEVADLIVGSAVTQDSKGVKL